MNLLLIIHRVFCEPLHGGTIFCIRRRKRGSAHAHVGDTAGENCSQQGLQNRATRAKHIYMDIRVKSEKEDVWGELYLLRQLHLAQLS